LKKVRVNHCGLIVLAAGMSSRMGSPKQVLPYKGQTLLGHSVEEAVGTGLQPIWVVLGASQDLLEKELEGKAGIQCIFNPLWQEGMASSIRCGVQTATRFFPEMDGLIIMVCDQPFVDRVLLKALLHTQHKTGMPLVASIYQGHPGVPALFHESFFDALLMLKGDQGARRLLKDEFDRVAGVSFPEGETDIDTIEDYMKLKEQKKPHD